MNKNLLRGELARLVMEDPQTIAEAFSKWSRDSEFDRLSSTDLAQPRSPKKIKEWIDKELEKEHSNFYWFMIRSLSDDRLIGDIGLQVNGWNHGESFVGIGLGERETWNKGYGSDAMRIILRYAFTELNLHRVSLNVFEYNPRAIRAYEKTGFVHEGRIRQYLKRDGRRWDLVFMGILQEEWEQNNPK